MHCSLTQCDVELHYVQHTLAHTIAVSFTINVHKSCRKLAAAAEWWRKIRIRISFICLFCSHLVINCVYLFFARSVLNDYKILPPNTRFICTFECVAAGAFEHADNRHRCGKNGQIESQ